jgi:hypothetical protein
MDGAQYTDWRVGRGDAPDRCQARGGGTPWPWPPPLIVAALAGGEGNSDLGPPRGRGGTGGAEAPRQIGAGAHRASRRPLTRPMRP